MVKVCEGHKSQVEKGCTYQIVPMGINTDGIGIKLGDTGVYLKDSECVVCTKLRNIHELVSLIGREMVGLGLIKYFQEEERRALFSVLAQMTDSKVREIW